MLFNCIYHSCKDNINNSQTQSYTKYKRIHPNPNIQLHNKNLLNKQPIPLYKLQLHKHQHHKTQPDISVHSSIPKLQHSYQHSQPHMIPSKVPSNLKAITSSNLNDSSQNNILYYFPNLYNQCKQNLSYINKPQTSYEIKRPEEKLKKGQNQLILEKLQEKFTSKLIYGKLRKTQTGSWFYKKKKSMSLRQLEKSYKHKANNSTHISAHSKKFIEKNIIDVDNKKENEVKKENGNEEKKEIMIDLYYEECKDGMNGNIKKDFGFKRNKVKYRKLNKDNWNKSLDEIGQCIKKERNIIKNTTNTNNNNINTIGSQEDSIRISTINHKDKKENTNIQNNNKEHKIKPHKSALNLHSHYELTLNKNISFSNNISNETERIPKHTNINNIFPNNNEFSCKTSSNFFKPSSSSTKSNNIDNIINRVLENNRKAAAMKTNNFFNEINRDFMKNQMRRTNNSFFKPPLNRLNTNPEKDFIPQPPPKTLNSLQLTLFSPLQWKQHEETWANISYLPFSSSDIEFHLLPPNETDILISSYIKLHPSLLNFCSFSKIVSSTQKEFNYLAFNIDDNIKNPKNEMKKWKDAYKISVHRWHPDKLYPLIEEMKLNNDNIKHTLKKKSTIIINNMNNLYKEIIEILKKVLLAKNNNEKEVN